METILKSDVLKILNKLKVEYLFINNTNTQYFTVASIFAPVYTGFYFFKGNEIPTEIKNSLIIVEDDFENIHNLNEFLVVKNEDCQRVYYQIINNLYAQQSSGEISKNSIVGKMTKIGTNVQIEDFCIIEDDVVLGNNVIIGSNTKIHKNTSIGDNTIIESNSIIGTQGVAWTWNTNQTKKIIQPQLGGVIIGENCFLGANTILVRGSLNEKTSIGNNTLMAPGCRIGHGSIIGDNVHMANNVTTGGNTKIGDFSFIGSGAIMRPKIKLHNKTIVGAGALVVKDTTIENLTLIGVPAKENQSKENPQGMPKPKI